jgi:hypothetical protein
MSSTICAGSTLIVPTCLRRQSRGRQRQRFRQQEVRYRISNQRLDPLGQDLRLREFANGQLSRATCPLVDAANNPLPVDHHAREVARRIPFCD